MAETAVRTKSTTPPESAYEGLSEREVIEIFNVGERRTLKPGEGFPLSEVADNPLFLWVLEGRVRLLVREGSSHRLVELEAGDWGGSLGFAQFSADTATAIDLAQVVTIPGKALQTVDPRLQLFIQRKLSAMAISSLRSPQSETENSEGKLSLLSRYVRKRREATWRKYVDSGLIQGIVQDVPQLPMFASNLAIRLREGGLSARETVDMAKQDPALAAAVMKAVNTRLPRLRGRVADLHQAITWLGLNQVHQLVIDHSLQKSLPDQPDFRQLRDHSLLVSMICAEVARLQPEGTPSRMSALGLLHQVGRCVILLLGLRHPQYRVLIDQLEHSRLGALLLRHWNLPRSIWNTLDHLAYPHFAPPAAVPSELRKDVAALYIAQLCLEHLESEQPNYFLGPFFDEYWDILELPAASLPELAEEKILPSLTGSEYSLPESVASFLGEATKRLRKRFEVDFLEG